MNNLNLITPKTAMPKKEKQIKIKLPNNPRDWTVDQKEQYPITYLFRVYLLYYTQRYGEKPVMTEADFAHFGKILKTLLETRSVDGIDFPGLDVLKLQAMIKLYFLSESKAILDAKHSFRFLIASETLRKLQIEYAKNINS